ncbi:hypothetical protein L1887_25610 [Cichorium endivia]|nr:hypothetical protein L1887_25610 [Cichorium endivia]
MSCREHQCAGGCEYPSTQASLTRSSINESEKETVTPIIAARKLIVAIIGKINRPSPAYKRKRNLVVKLIQKNTKRINTQMAQPSFNRWNKVEIKLHEGEFVGGIYSGMIVGVWNHRYEVRLTTLTDGETGGPMVVHVRFVSVAGSAKDLGAVQAV